MKAKQGVTRLRKEQQPQDCSQSQDRKKGFHLTWEYQGGCLQVPCPSSSPGFYSFLWNLARREGEAGEGSTPSLSPFHPFQSQWPVATGQDGGL